MKTLAIGKSDFEDIMKCGNYFVDKSLFIKEVIQDNFSVLLLPRPRRFGKTLNLSMLQCFFEKTEESKENLFNGLKIKDETIFKKHLSKYPVISMSFKDVKQDSYEESFNQIKELIYEEFKRHKYLLKSNKLDEAEKIDFEAIYKRKGHNSLYNNALKNLSLYLFKHYNQKAIILIDEYDTPVQMAYSSDYYDKMIIFMQTFLGAGLKDNKSIYKAVITGILKIAQESVFSPLNNLGVYTLLEPNYAEYFGFTEPEVIELLKYYNALDIKEELIKWYDGYTFGDTEKIYNPWSTLSFLSNRKKEFKPYWVNTASNNILRELVGKADIHVKKGLEDLLKDKPIRKKIDTDIVFREIEGSESDIYNFLLFSGYLKAYDKKLIEGEFYYTLAFPNKEIKIVMKKVVAQWFNHSSKDKDINEMLKSLINGDIKLFEKYLSKFILETLSYFDTAGKNIEKVYQAFILGLLVNLKNDYEINSEKESGFGRYDISIIPKDKNKTAIIMELKTIDEFENETKDKALNSALNQIIEKKYDTSIKKRGIKDILMMGIVFDGKRAWIKSN